MATITALRGTRRGGIALEVDDEYLCTVSESLVARWRLHKGRELSDVDVDALRAQASSERIMADAYRLLGHRARSQAELRSRLLGKGHEECAVSAAIANLVDSGYLDDAAFARSFVADKRRLAGWGSSRIRRGLAELGVDADVADAALTRGDDTPEAECQRALRLLERGGRPQPPLETARRRAYQALMRRGFSGTVAYQAVRDWSGGAPPSGSE